MASIEELMRLLECSETEAQSIIEADARIDKGEKLFELDEQGKQAEKKMRSCVRTVNPYGKATTRERPQDLDKRFLIETFELALSPFTDNVEIVNPEREMTFVYKGKKFKIVLSCPRK